MVHKFKNKVDNFLFSEMPVDSMDYERKGGCFVTISKGVILTIIFVIFGCILGLLVFYTTKHAYEKLPPTSIEEYIQHFEEIDHSPVEDVISPKHYRIIINPILHDRKNQFSFNGNVWITVTSNEDDTKMIELDVQNLDIRTEDVSVYRSRILSDLDFQYEGDRERRSAQLTEDDFSNEKDGEFDLLMNSTEVVESNATTDVEKEFQELIGETGEITTNISTDINESQTTEGTDIIDNSTEASVTESSDPSVIELTDSSTIESTDSPSTDYIDYVNITATWNGLQQNDSILLEPNPDDQTELKIDSLQFDTERRKLIIKLDLPLRKGHYYIVKVFFRGNMSSEYGLVFKSYNETESNDHTNDWTLDVYERTSLMKLNNFGFVITNIEPIIITVTANLLLNSYFRPTLLPSITFIDSEIPLLLKKFEAYTNATYPMESISFIGLPNSSNEIIEIKPGLVIASESFFIALNEADKLNKAAAITHQMGKLWIQPLEIIDHKDQEWINEGLPLQLKLISDGSQKNDYFNSESLIEKRMEAMRKDHSFIEFKLKEFSNHHSDNDWIDVAQSKGLYLLEILEEFLTEPEYKMGIQRFFKSNGPTNFIESFNNLTMNESNDVSIPMAEIISKWSQQIGYPIIHIKKDPDSVQIQQTQFGKSNSSQFWITPLIIENQTIWLTKNAMNFDISDSNWLTVKSNGYFRVNYDQSHWNSILNALQLDYKFLSVINRAILMDDALNLAKYNYLDYTTAIKLLEYWNEQETEYLPWKAALVNLEFVYRNSIDFAVNSEFNILLKNLTQRTYQNIVRSPMGGFSYKLKVLIKTWSCQIFALPDCVADNRKEFQNLITNDTLKRSQRSSTDVEQLYCTAIKFGGTENWYLVKNSFDQQNNHDYNGALIYSLGCSFDYSILSDYFQLLFHESYMGYAETIFRSMKDNQLGKKYALEFLYSNFEQLYDLHGLHTLKILLKSIATQYDYQLFQLFFSNNSSLFSSKDKKTLAEVVYTIKNTLYWRKNFADVFNT